MAKAPKTSGTTTPKTEYIAEWKHYAVVSMIADLGTQFVQSKEYGDRNVRQLYVMRELPEIKHVFSEDKWPQSVVFGNTYTFSMWKKAKLRSVVENILGKPFKDDDVADDYDVADLIGRSCKLSMVHNGDYVNIFSIIDCEADPKIKPELEQKTLFLDDFNSNTFGTLPNWLQEKIRVSPEYSERVSTTTWPVEETTDSNYPF